MNNCFLGHYHELSFLYLLIFVSFFVVFEGDSDFVVVTFAYGFENPLNSERMLTKLYPIVAIGWNLKFFTLHSHVYQIIEMLVLTVVTKFQSANKNFEHF